MIPFSIGISFSDELVEAGFERLLPGRQSNSEHAFGPRRIKSRIRGSARGARILFGRDRFEFGSLQSTAGESFEDCLRETVPARSPLAGEVEDASHGAPVIG
jgi:hypothetical protein